MRKYSVQEVREMREIIKNSLPFNDQRDILTEEILQSYILAQIVPVELAPWRPVHPENNPPPKPAHMVN